MLVGLAAALYCLIMLETLHNPGVQGEEIGMDPLRLVNAVTSGVAFLAAGMIVFSQGKVRGLTTGTSLWLAAAVGLSSGFGDVAHGCRLDPSGALHHRSDQGRRAQGHGQPERRYLAPAPRPRIPKVGMTALALRNVKT